MTRLEEVPCPHCGRPPVQDGEASPFCPKCRFPIRPIAGKYRLIRQLARGGGGTVYLAHHLKLTREPARVIKIIHPECLEVKSLYIRFQREVEVTAMLSRKNQHIVRIYDDFGEEPWIGAYYVMEYLEGTTLMDLLYQKGTLPLFLIKKIFGQLCRAMAAAHQEGIIHRDLKPPNIFLIQHEKEPYFVKVIDFGIAKSLEAHTQHDLTQGSMGTPTYMSPEQCMNEEIDGRADIYSMGCILYEMLTGSPPFTIAPDVPKPPPWAIMQRHISEAPENLRQRRPDLHFSEALNKVVMRAIEKKPSMRFPEVMAFWQAFDDALPDKGSFSTVDYGQSTASTVRKAVAAAPKKQGQSAKRVYFEAPEAEETRVRPSPSPEAFSPPTKSPGLDALDDVPTDAFIGHFPAAAEHSPSFLDPEEATAITPMPERPKQASQALDPDAPTRPIDVPDSIDAIGNIEELDKHNAMRVVGVMGESDVDVILGLEIADSTEATDIHRVRLPPPAAPTPNAHVISIPATQPIGLPLIAAIIGVILSVALTGSWLLGDPSRTEAPPQERMIASLDAGLPQPPGHTKSPAAPCKRGQTKPCYQGPAGTKGKGICKAGTQTCLLGQWTPCQEQVGPQKEVCNGLDDNCDGKIDEAFPKVGKACTQAWSGCRFRGTMGCTVKKPTPHCQMATKPVPAPGQRQLQLRLYPRRLRIKIKYGARTLRARRQACLHLPKKRSVTFSAKGHHACILTLQQRKRRVTIRLKKSNELGEVHDYCKGK